MANKHFEEFAQDCANKLASQIEAGKAPWELGGVPAAYPVDAISGKPLQGITALQLMVREKTSGFEDNRWLTPSQIAVLGASVKKGSQRSSERCLESRIRGRIQTYQDPTNVLQR